MTERYTLGIDIGTTSVKAVLASSSGKLVDEVNASHDLTSLYPGWAEGRAQDWWSNTIKVVRALAERNPGQSLAIECIGVTGMVPAIVMLDESGEPIRNAIQQNDRESTLLRRKKQ